MKDTTRRQATQAGGAQAVFMSRILMLVLAFMLLPALAAGPSSGGAPKGNPRLASLQIEIWPEFDRRGAALVILKGELAASLALPVSVSLRNPATSGGPTAVAFATARGAELFNLAHDRTRGDGFITLRFDAPQRVFHVEFYDPLVTVAPDRTYTYVWPGDPSVQRLSVRLQEPAAASNISVQPDLGAGVAGPDGLLYRSAELGAREAGKPLPITIRYTKTDSRTSAEILGVKPPDATPPATTGSAERVPRWLLILAVAAGLGIAAGAAALWWRQRGKTSVGQPAGAGFCPKCSAKLGSGARFCPTCGTPVRNK
jgi:hypothetical protein